jgi:hypothetical protein
VRRLTIVAVALLAACGAPSQGVVVGKDYSPAYSTTQCNLVGKVTVCSPTYWPERYDLKIRSGEDEGWRSVDPETYRTTSVGDFVDFGASR